VTEQNFMHCVEAGQIKKSYRSSFISGADVSFSTPLIVRLVFPMLQDNGLPSI